VGFRVAEHNCEEPAAFVFSALCLQIVMPTPQGVG
jgi:hypothetical protein